MRREVRDRGTGMRLTERIRKLIPETLTMDPMLTLWLPVGHRHVLTLEYWIDKTPV